MQNKRISFSSVFLMLATMFGISTCTATCILNGTDFEVIVDLTTALGNMRRIWDNTGFSPPGAGEEAVEYLTSKEVIVNLALIGSLPFKGISHVRIHWLLDLIKLNELDADYQLLDYLMDWLRRTRMRPGFELMGNPGNLFNDLDSNPETVILWQDLITDVATHFIDKYGQEEVKKWRFELWNEPDSTQYNILNLTTSGYMKYVEASIKALNSKGVAVSGPAGTFRDFDHHNKSWSVLEMCNSMMAVSRNCSLETITFHKKGGGDAQQVFLTSEQFFSMATTEYPLIKKMPWANNEADILSGWWREETWRGDVNYAAKVCEVLMDFLATVNQQNFSVAYISNDNAFINQPPAYFNQRTLLTRFQMKNSEDYHSEFVRKPVMVTMALLSYLGSKEVPVFRRQRDNTGEPDSRLSVIAASDGVTVGPGWSAAIVVAVSALTSDCSSKVLGLQLKLPSNLDLTYVVYQLDNQLTNPRKVWEEYGKPDFPDVDILKEIRNNEGPHVVRRGSLTGEWQTLMLSVNCPSVTMVHLCSRSWNLPAKVLNLHAVNITYNEVLLLWQDSDTKCVKTYEVYFSSESSGGEFRLISNGTLIMLAHQFTAPESSSGVEDTRGMYKVRLCDYWDRCSAFSDVLMYP